TSLDPYRSSTDDDNERSQTRAVKFDWSEGFLKDFSGLNYCSQGASPVQLCGSY
ncbi:uncharacterized, partial [Tachysurus ichikawai]